MSYTIVSWNINGFHDRAPRQPRRLILRQELQRALVGSTIDVLMLQEHMLSEAEIRHRGSLLPGRGHSVWSPAAGRSGGVCISVSAALSQEIFDSGELIPGRAVWVGVQIGELRVGFLSVYAPACRQHRGPFWRQLTGCLPAVDSWVVGGDFNNLESAEDKSGGAPFAGLPAAERGPWEQFIFAIRGCDPWREPAFTRWRGSLDFSFGFRRSDGLLERLDRFYVGDWALGWGGATGILSGTTMSDHRPIALQLHRPPAPLDRGIRIPDALFQEAEVQAAIQSIWEREESEPPPLEGWAAWVADAIQRSSSACQEIALARRQALYASERALRRDLASIERLRDQHPRSAWLTDRYEAARVLLQDTEARRAEFAYHASRARWTQQGDRMTKEFFQLTGPRFSGS